MSAANINRVTITGNLTKDPELRAVGESGIEVCDLRVAVNARRKKGDEWIDVPNYFDVVIWGKRGKLCDDFLARGSGVAVDGRLGVLSWVLYGSGKLGAVMTAAMTLNLLLAALVGVLAPMIRNRLGQDPAVGSSVIITAVTDSGGFFIFLGLATIFLM